MSITLLLNVSIHYAIKASTIIVSIENLCLFSTKYTSNWSKYFSDIVSFLPCVSSCHLLFQLVIKTSLITDFYTHVYFTKKIESFCSCYIFGRSYIGDLRVTYFYNYWDYQTISLLLCRRKKDKSCRWWWIKSARSLPNL